MKRAKPVHAVRSRIPVLMIQRDMESSMEYFTTIAKEVTIKVPFGEMPQAVQEKIIAYGCQRIFNDMVGGLERFPTVKDKVDHVNAMIVKFLSGDIGRSARTGLGTEALIGRGLARVALKTRLGAKSPEWKSFIGLSDNAQDEKLDAIFAKNAEKMAPDVAAELKRRAELAAKRDKLADGLDLDF